MKTDDFDYYLPEELIAQVPLEHREESKLLVLDKDTGEIIDDKFYDIINYLNKGDLQSWKKKLKNIIHQIRIFK